MIIPDAITINPFCGLDTIEPFVKTAKDYDKGLFVLVRTSNPGSGELQDAKLADGRTWSEMLAEKLASIAADPAWSARTDSARSARSSAPRAANDAEPAAEASAIDLSASGYGAQVPRRK